MVKLVGHGQAFTAEQLQIGAGHSLQSSGRCRLRCSLLVGDQYLDVLPRATCGPAIYLLSRRSVAGNQLLQELWG